MTVKKKGKTAGSFQKFAFFGHTNATLHLWVHSGLLTHLLAIKYCSGLLTLILKQHYFSLFSSDWISFQLNHPVNHRLSFSCFSSLFCEWK